LNVSRKLLAEFTSVNFGRFFVREALDHVAIITKTGITASGNSGLRNYFANAKAAIIRESPSGSAGWR
jgi:hypothetical protein